MKKEKLKYRYIKYVDYRRRKKLDFVGYTAYALYLWQGKTELEIRKQKYSAGGCNATGRGSLSKAQIEQAKICILAGAKIKDVTKAFNVSLSYFTKYGITKKNLLKQRDKTLGEQLEKDLKNGLGA